MTEEEQLKIIQAKLNITDKRTVKQILAHKELCEDIINRDVISEQELVEEYQIPQSHLKSLKQQNKLSFFASTGEVNKISRGSKVYYFVDEVKDLFGYNIRYNKSHSFKKSIFNKLVVDMSTELCTSTEAGALKMFLINNLSVEEIGEHYIITNERTNQLISKAYRRIVSKVFQLNKMFKSYRTNLEYQTENELLKKQNTELYNKFLRVKENDVLKDLKSNTNVEHFVKHGYDVKDLVKGLHEFKEYLSVRALTCLKNAYIENLDELLSYPKRDLIRLRNMGEKTVSEICDWLEDKYNWELK
jgi:hypothetical protein